MSATMLGRSARHARKRNYLRSVSRLRSRLGYWLWRQVDGLIGPLTPAKYRAFWVVAPLLVVAFIGVLGGAFSGLDWVDALMSSWPHHLIPVLIDG